MWHLKMIDSRIGEKEARQFLGGFNFQGDRVFEPINHFSGGEKARLALALLVWQQPNILLLDEPSNHLDLEMREALATALQFYQGALILITHDRFLLNSLADELYLIANNQVKAFVGDINDYQKWFAEESKRVANQEKPKAIVLSVSKKTDHEKNLKKLECKLSDLEQKISVCESILSDPTLYKDGDSCPKLISFQDELQCLKSSKEQVEEEALTLMELLTN